MARKSNPAPEPQAPEAPKEKALNLSKYYDVPAKARLAAERLGLKPNEITKDNLDKVDAEYVKLGGRIRQELRRA